jgi:RNA polymerase sigma-54 factor
MVLAPQLQQSLALLQAPTLELKALIEQELQQNPVLEEDASEEIDLQDKADREGESQDPAADPAEPPADLNSDPVTEKNPDGPADGAADDFQAEFDRLAQLDQEWRDSFSQSNSPIRASAEDEERRQFMFDSLVAGTSLQQMLVEQVHESTLPEAQWPIAELIIGNIDDYGYLKATVEEIAAPANLPADKILDVLKVIQTFDPCGVGARDLRECLLLQLERSGHRETLEYRIVSEFMEALGKRRIPEIARGTGAEVDEVQEALERIARLEPRPGRAFLPDNDQYVLPEVLCSAWVRTSWSRPITSIFPICGSATPTKI